MASLFLAMSICRLRLPATPRAMCCLGCQAVAQAIVANGLTDYYRSRDALPESPREALPTVLDQLALFDHADFQKSFVRAWATAKRKRPCCSKGLPARPVSG